MQTARLLLLPPHSALVGVEICVDFFLSLLRARSLFCCKRTIFTSVAAHIPHRYVSKFHTVFSAPVFWQFKISRHPCSDRPQILTPVCSVPHPNFHAISKVQLHIFSPIAGPLDGDRVCRFSKQWVAFPVPQIKEDIPPVLQFAVPCHRPRRKLLRCSILRISFLDFEGARVCLCSRCAFFWQRVQWIHK